MKKFYDKKNILITGHSGFKGGWASLFLNNIGSNVYGLSDMNIESGIYKTIKKEGVFKNEFKGDIGNSNFLTEHFKNNDYDFVFHFAAQGIVSKAHENPKKTIMTNVLGTLNLLEAANRNENIKTIVIATTDKVYAEHNAENNETYKLGGKEYYSASKASTEHIITAFNNTSKRGDLNIGVVRAGNVLGGGDYGKDRILTDLITSLNLKNPIDLRNPNSIRPWQYILDSIIGYLLVAKYCNENSLNEIFNLNSSLNNKYNVNDLVEKIIKYWNPDFKIDINLENNQNFYESEILTINSDKAKNSLGWDPKFNIDDICKNIVEYEKSKNKFEWSLKHVEAFLSSYL